MDSRELPFSAHLAELRTSLRNSAIAVLIGFGASFYWSERLFRWLVKPLTDAMARAKITEPLKFFDVVEPFFTYMKVAFYAGIFLSSPFVFHQIWRFIAPGLYDRERRIAVPFAVSSALLFTGGAAFCYFLALPGVFDFLLTYKSDLLEPALSMQKQLDIELKLLIAFGLCFEMPLLVFFLAHIGLVTHRSLWRFNRYAIVLIFIVAAILTPPDVFSQTFLAVPLLALYNISILIAYLVTKSRERRVASVVADDDKGNDDDAGPGSDDSGGAGTALVTSPPEQS